MPNGSEELWLKTVRGQDKRGVPLARRRTNNPAALDQTRRLERYRTQTHVSLAERKQQELGSGACQMCGAELPPDLTGCREKRSIWLPNGVVQRYYVGPECT